MWLSKHNHETQINFYSKWKYWKLDNTLSSTFPTSKHAVLYFLEDVSFFLYRFHLTFSMKSFWYFIRQLTKVDFKTGLFSKPSEAHYESPYKQTCWIPVVYPCCYRMTSVRLWSAWSFVNFLKSIPFNFIKSKVEIKLNYNFSDRHIKNKSK